MNWKLISILPLFMSLSACGGDLGGEQDDLMQPTRIPEQVCGQATKGMEKLQQTGGFVLNAPGEATIDEQAWLRMDERQRNDFVRLIAYDAACKSPTPVTEQNTIVRSEYGRVLTERVQEIATDPATVLQE
jgi:hypothetical protein